MKTFNTRKEAKAWVSTVEVKRNDGAYRPTISKATFASYLTDVWLPWYCKRRPRSAYNTERTLTRWIVDPPSGMPLIGRKKLRDLSVEHFDALYLEMQKQHSVQDRGIRYRTVCSAASSSTPSLRNNCPLTQRMVLTFRARSLARCAT